jgi:MFS transporter, PPP family, 3-phenylpropionic acid transporter
LKKSIPFTFYFFYFAAAAFTMPYVILYYQDLGFNGAQIGLLAGLFPLVIMVGAPAWTRLADSKSCHRLVMSLTIAISILITAIFPLFKNFFIVLPLSVLYAFFIAPVISLADSATLHMLGSEKSLYGRVRLGGTIGWGAMALVAGYTIQTYGTRWVFWGYALIMVVVFFISQKLVHSTRAAIESPAGSPRGTFVNRQWVVFLLLAVIAGVCLTIINNFLSPYLKALGISQSFMGIALLISIIGELPVLFYSNYLLRRFGAFRLVILSNVVSGVRLLLLAGVNSIPGILSFQLLNGMTYPLFMVAAVSHTNEISPEGMKATGQGIMGAAVNGIGASIGGLLAGLLMGSIGMQAMFFSIGAVMLVSVVVIAMLEWKRYPQAQVNVVN